jgi:hypothetical protein
VVRNVYARTHGRVGYRRNFSLVGLRFQTITRHMSSCNAPYTLRDHELYDDRRIAAIVFVVTVTRNVTVVHPVVANRRKSSIDSGYVPFRCNLLLKFVAISLSSQSRSTNGLAFHRIPAWGNYGRFGVIALTASLTP